MKIAKMIKNILVTINIMIMIMMCVTYIDIVSHNLDGMNGGTIQYTLPTTGPIVDWMLEQGKGESPSFLFQRYRSGQTARRTAAKTQLWCTVPNYWLVDSLGQRKPRPAAKTQLQFNSAARCG